MKGLLEGSHRVVCEECHQPDSQSISCCSMCGLICQKCFENHQCMTSYSDHVTVSLEQGQGDSLKTKMASVMAVDNTSRLKCEKHKEEALRMYCMTCKRLICTLCTLDSHQPPNHQVTVLSKAAQALRVEMKQMVESIKETHTQALQSVEASKEAQQTFCGQREVSKSLIEASFQALHERLDLLKQKFLEDIETDIDTNVSDNMFETIKNTSTKAVEIENLINMTEQAIDHTTDQEFLDLKRFMAVRLKESSSKKVEPFHVSPVQLSTTFSTELVQLMCDHVKCHHSPSLEASYASGLRKASIGKEMSFLVHAVNNREEPCIDKYSVTVEIVLSRSGETVPVTVMSSLEIGTHVVKYVPKLKGEYKVSIRIEGNEISKSPYFVLAKGLKPTISQPTTIISQLEWPWGVACSVDRLMYITRNYHHTIAVFNKEGRQVRKIGLKGQKPGNLWHPTGIAVDNEGNVFVADGQENGRVQKLSKQGHLLAIYSKLRNPHGLLLNKKKDMLYVCDKGHGTVVVLGTDLKEIRIFGELDHFSASGGYENISGHLHAPHSLAEDDSGLIYVSDTQDHYGCVHVFTIEGMHVREIKHPRGEFAPTGIAIDDDHLYVCDIVKNCLFVFLISNGQFMESYGCQGHVIGQFNYPLSLAFDFDGFLCMTDYSNNRVQVF